MFFILYAAEGDFLSAPATVAMHPVSRGTSPSDIGIGLDEEGEDPFSGPLSPLERVRALRTGTPSSRGVSPWCTASSFPQEDTFQYFRKMLNDLFSTVITRAGGKLKEQDIDLDKENLMLVRYHSHNLLLSAFLELLNNKTRFALLQIIHSIIIESHPQIEGVPARMPEVGVTVKNFIHKILRQQFEEKYLLESARGTTNSLYENLSLSEVEKKHLVSESKDVTPWLFNIMKRALICSGLNQDSIDGLESEISNFISLRPFAVDKNGSRIIVPGRAFNVFDYYYIKALINEGDTPAAFNDCLKKHGIKDRDEGFSHFKDIHDFLINQIKKAEKASSSLVAH